MPGTDRVQIDKNILHWALRESQKEEDEVIERFPKITNWIEGDKNPTFKQLQRFADFLKIPFGYLFLEKPPESDMMEVDFRSINSKLPTMSKNLKDAIAAMDLKRSWMSDYRKDLGWSKLGIIEEFDKHKKNAITYDAFLARELLGLEEDWYRDVRQYGETYAFLKDALEANGILVMQNGVVGSNNYRVLDVNEFRAFVLYDHLAPIIFINNNDSFGGKIFSLVHEYIHILFGQEDLLIAEDIFSKKDNERYINQVTGEFLMPAAHIHDVWEKQADPLQQIDNLALLFKVSGIAIAIKLSELALINEEILKVTIDEGLKRFEARERESGTGGNFYNTFNTRISPTFTRAVIRSVEAGDMDYNHAFRLLGGIRGKTYDAIKDKVLPYG